MEVFQKPDHVIELDLYTVYRQVIFWTAFPLLTGAGALFLFHEEARFGFSLSGVLLWFGLYCVLIVLHEAVHLAGFLVFGKCRLKDLVWGVNFRIGAAYAGTKKALRVSAMKKALLLPFWITGFFPFAAGIALNSPIWMAAGAFLIGGAAGDFSMYRQLTKISPGAWIKDDIHAPKLYVYNQYPEKNKHLR